jgi:hypothetical protein
MARDLFRRDLYFRNHGEKEPMRPGQQNRRSRNRNNNRKGPNPLSRSYESNGPDVKIRGNAQHIADKYAQLARDANASGDRVIAENYLQHAEHYNRIIAAAQAQLGIQQVRERDDDDGEGDDGDEIDTTNVAQGVDGDYSGGSGPQPVFAETPAEVAFEETDFQASASGNRGERVDRADRGERGERGERGDNDRRGRRQRPFNRNRHDQGGRGDRDDQPSVAANPAPLPESADEEGPSDGRAIGWLQAAGQD